MWKALGKHLHLEPPTTLRNDVHLGCAQQHVSYNINDHTRVVTPRITITEIPPDANINDQYGDS